MAARGPDATRTPAGDAGSASTPEPAVRPDGGRAHERAADPAHAGRRRGAPRHPARLASLLGPPLAVMAVIWWLSDQSHLSTDLGTIDLVLRKGAHVTEYAVLTLLWARAWDGLGLRRSAALAAAVALAWAALDELHQSGVVGRVGTPRDVAIDAVGVLLAVVVWRRLRRDRGGGRHRDGHRPRHRDRAAEADAVRRPPPRRS